MRLITLIAACCCLVCSSAGADSRPILLPTPKKVIWLEGRISQSADSALGRAIVASEAKEITAGLKEFADRLRALGVTLTKPDANSKSASTLWVGTQKDLVAAKDLPAGAMSVPKEAAVPEGYILRCVNSGGQDYVICAGYDARGCYYGLQTLMQLVSVSDNKASIPRVDITDWPTYKLRIVKCGTAGDKAANVARWVGLMPSYKANVLASQFQPKTAGKWREPAKSFLDNAETVGRGARETGAYDAMMYMGPFGEDRGSLTDAKVIEGYIDKLLYWGSQGYTWFGIDFNDWYNEKNITPEESEKIGDLGEIMAMVTNAAYKGVRAKYPNAGFVTVPGNGHYKAATPAVIKFCSKIPADVLVASAGDVKKATEYSDPVTVEFLKGWAAKTGRKPYLWDNCLYRQQDYYAPLVQRMYNFESYANRFPPNAAELFGGPAIHLNGGAHRWWEPGVLTFLDYTWNPEAYDPVRSLRNARVLLWGEKGADAAEVAQKAVYDFRAYMHDIYTKKIEGSNTDAMAKYTDVEKAVKALAEAVGDPAMAEELETQCLAQAKTVINRVYAPEKPAAKRSPKRKQNEQQ